MIVVASHCRWLKLQADILTEYEILEWEKETFCLYYYTYLV